MNIQESAERRESRRIRFNGLDSFQVQMKFADHVITAVPGDISEQGLSVIIPFGVIHQPDLWQLVTIRIQGPHLNQPFEAQCKVVRKEVIENRNQRWQMFGLSYTTQQELPDAIIAADLALQ
ncbi:MAG: PilZ domain-containing protein [Leptospiraceae bacterium]|nr:PilZ domain-containing protein [Leptospiraceae bacterium]